MMFGSCPQGEFGTAPSVLDLVMGAIPTHPKSIIQDETYIGPVPCFFSIRPILGRGLGFHFNAMYNYRVNTKAEQITYN